MGVRDRQGAGKPPRNGHSSAQVSSRLLVGRLGRSHANCIAGEYYINQYNIIGSAGVYCPSQGPLSSTSHARRVPITGLSNKYKSDYVRAYR